MKKLGFLLLLIFIGCNNNEDKLKSRIQELEAQVQELQNGAERRIVQIRDAYQNKNYETAQSYSEQLIKLHPGSKEAIEAQKHLHSIDSIFAIKKELAKQEEEKRKKEAEKSQADKIHEIIRVKNVRTSEPNSAGGVDFSIYWQNTGKKTIKYATFSAFPYNKVKDIVYCSVKSRSEFSGEVTGPIKSGEWNGGGRFWECAWYNNTIVFAVLSEITLEYMDGTKVTLKDNDLKYVIY